MKFSVQIYRDEDGAYIAECPSIPGCISQGRTHEEARTNIADAIRECLTARTELGMPLTIQKPPRPSTSPPPTTSSRFPSAIQSHPPE